MIILYMWILNIQNHKFKQLKVIQWIPVYLIGLVIRNYHNKQAIRLSRYHILLMIDIK